MQVRRHQRERFLLRVERSELSHCEYEVHMQFEQLAQALGVQVWSVRKARRKQEHEHDDGVEGGHSLRPRLLPRPSLLGDPAEWMGSSASPR